MKLLARIVISFATGLLALSATGQGVPTHRTVKVGDTAKYKFDVSINVGGQLASLATTVTEKVTNVDGNGNYTVEAIASNSKAKSNGEDLPASQDSTLTTTTKPNGEVVQIVGDRDGPEAYRYANLMAVVLPLQPVKVADAWTIELKANPKTGAAAIKATYKVDGEERIGTIDTYRVKFTTTEVGTPEQSANDETVWISKADASIVKLEANMQRILVPNAPAPVNCKVTESRIG